MNERPSRTGIRAAALLIALVAAVLASGWWAVGVLAITLLLAAALDRSALRPVLRPRWGLVLLLLIVPGAFFVGAIDTVLAGGIMISSAGLELGLVMACRATTIFVAVNAFSRSISVMQLTSALERVGMPGLGFAIGVGFHALPTIKQRFIAAYSALRLRGGFRQQRWRALQLLLITVIMGALRYGEEVVLAAEARGFQYADSDTEIP
ncbi:MAG: hypothetical protein JW910_16565 [Anaerolineae bacterium]|nr:hypothetical protein [Anaerolineae bacterium]